MKKLIWISIVFLFSQVLMMPQGIRNSRHNFSTQGKGGIRASNTSMICIFCHTSHTPAKNHKAPLWNRKESHVTEYILYESSTLYSVIGQPDGASKLCLSCHDGTISVGSVLNRGTEFQMRNTNAGRIPPGKRSNFGTNISDDHPISFDSSIAVSGSNELIHPSAGDPVHYDNSDKLQCTSCHDPHKELNPRFLIKTMFNAELCKTCHHLNGYNGISTHDISTKSWNGSGENPLPNSNFSSIADNSCNNCHQSHNAGGNERLLSHQIDSQNCLKCHDGNTGLNILSEISKGFSHRVTAYNNIHDPVENLITSSIHVMCMDCHDPHKVNSSSASAPFIKGKMGQVSGMTIDGNIINESAFEYEVCLKCHGQDRYNNSNVLRQHENSNVRKAFAQTNASFHAVATSGTSTFVPSLRPGWSESSRLYCTDCHNNNNARKNGGTGPNGPHGSTNDYLLERRYISASLLPYIKSNFDLCWKCHRQGIVLSEDQTRFKYHKKHIIEENTPCSVCHDPHGSRQNLGLINFDMGVVFPNEDGKIKFEVIGNKGYCYLDCHGENHNPEDYER